ncbi:cache domain-containing protein [Marinomonas dokdonensis]|uniref:cache domain-containing protein n=1 Tax=Marinomonas dokdonensis TaxID=328224 RepID=UPI0040556AD0
MVGLKSKVFLLALVPLIMATSIITFLSLQSARELAEEELSIYEFNLVNAKKEALISHVDIALTAIQQVLDDESLTDIQAQQQVKQILTNLRYSDDGYFFAYEMSGVNLVHPTIPGFVGQDLWSFQDSTGNHLIQGLISIAQAGGGYYRYIWEKPPLMTQEEKISYVVSIDRWNWMMGTGLYLDDVYDELAKTKQTMNDNIQRSFISVLIVVVITVLLVILLGVAINLHEHKLADTRLNEMAQRFMRLQVNERRGFSRELHDGINQLLVSCKFRVELAGNKLRRAVDDEAVQLELEKANDLINQTISEVRQISHNLRPTILDDLGLDSALRSLIDQFTERTNMQVDYNYQVTFDMADEVETSIYRLTQEALTNIEKHAQATQVVLSFIQTNQQLEFTCQDNGVGINKTGKASPGIGFINMRERLELIGGEFSVSSHKGQGTRIYAAFPV